MILSRFLQARVCTLRASRIVSAIALICICGCGERKSGPPIIPRQSSDGAPFVTIGRIDTTDGRRKEEVTRFFESAGIPCFTEGTLLYSVMVPEKDIDRVRSLLRTNRPTDADFHSIWDKVNAPPLNKKTGTH